MEFEERAKQIAKETKLDIIEMEMEEWGQSVKDYKQQIRDLEVRLENAKDKCELWIRALVLHNKRKT